LRLQRYDFFVNHQNFSQLFYKNSQKNCFYALVRRFYATFATEISHLINILMEQTRVLVDTIVKGIQEKKGKGIVVADLEGIDGTICRYFVVCQGNSPSQVEAITESIGDMTRTELHEKPMRIVGLENAVWVAMDYGDVLVHVFVPDVRQYYDLEHLWADAKLTRIEDLD